MNQSKKKINYNLVFVGDLGHTGQIWPQILDGLSSAGWKIFVLTPRLSLAQKRFFGLNYEGRKWRYVTGVKFKSPYRPLAGYPKLIRAFLQTLSIFKTKFSLRPNKDKDIYQGWESEAINLLKKKHLATKFDFIISSSSPFISHLIAKKFSEDYGVPWAADYRDLWSLNHNLPNHSNYDKILEQTILKSAKFCITTSNGFAKQLSEIYSGDIFQVHNGYNKLNLVNKPKLRNKFIVSYLGQIWESFQNISPLLLAFNELQPSYKDKFQLEINGWAINTVKKSLRDLGISQYNWVKFGKVMNIDDTIYSQNESDLLVLLFSNNSKISGVLLTKLYEYLASGTPILAIGNNLQDEVLDILRNAGNSIILSTDSEIKKFLVDFANKKVIFPERNLNYLKELSRLEQGKCLASFISKIIEVS